MSEVTGAVSGIVSPNPPKSPINLPGSVMHGKINFKAATPSGNEEQVDKFIKQQEKDRKNAKRGQYFNYTVLGLIGLASLGSLGLMAHQTGWFKKFKLDFVDLTGQKGLKDMAMPDSQKKSAEGIKNYINNFDEIYKKGGGQGTAILMYGPPGTGKNTFAYAIAKEFPNSKFIDMDVSKMNSKWFGESEQNILGTMEATVKYAKEHKDEKIFVFLDEIDSVMMQDHGNGAKLSQDILNAFKKGFNKLTKEKNIIVIGATNLHIDPKMAQLTGKALDSAMLDRFGEKVLVDLPDKNQIKIAFTNFYKNSERGLIDETLKDINNPILDKIAEFLSQKEHQTSFRKLEEGIFKQAARKSKIGEKLTYQDIINAIIDNKQNLNITDTELEAFLNSIK